MAVYQYVEQFMPELQKKYEREMTSYLLTQSNKSVKFINAKTIKLPRLTLSGYRDHDRNGNFNRGTLGNDYEAKTLKFDRDVEFKVDPMDVDETNLTLEMANIQNQFEEEQAIPEKDSYRYSKLYAEATDYSAAGARITTEAITEENFLEYFDEEMARMDDKSVPQEGRVMYITSTINKCIKEAHGISRNISAGAAGVINRTVHSIDDVQKIVVPSSRMKTTYDFTDGCVPGSLAKQMNMILVHPSCVVSRDKYSYIQVFTPGHDSNTADCYMFQNRYYTDTFILERKACGISINAAE